MGRLSVSRTSGYLGDETYTGGQEVALTSWAANNGCGLAFFFQTFCFCLPTNYSICHILSWAISAQEQKQTTVWRVLLSTVYGYELQGQWERKTVLHLLQNKMLQITNTLRGVLWWNYSKDEQFGHMDHWYIWRIKEACKFETTLPTVSVLLVDMLREYFVNHYVNLVEGYQNV